jgi:hypothetical protein
MPKHILIENPEDFQETTQSHPLGATFEDYNGNVYRYGQNGSATAAVKGAPAHKTATRGVYKKHANKVALVDTGVGIAGAWAAAVAAGAYGFVLADGYADYLLGDTGTAAGEAVTVLAGDIWATAVVGTHVILGQAFTDDAASIFSGEINCL